MNRVLPFCLGVGAVSVAYGNVRENLYQQQRAIRTKLSSHNMDDDTASRTAILAELDNHRKTIFQSLGNEYNQILLDIYQSIAGTRPQ
jgi:hypothetical protein